MPNKKKKKNKNLSKNKRFNQQKESKARPIMGI
jgi:hypothetical protein